MVEANKGLKANDNCEVGKLGHLGVTEVKHSVMSFSIASLIGQYFVFIMNLGGVKV